MLYISQLFRHPTLAQVREREISATEFALHDAKLTLERAQVTVQLFEARLKRLKVEHANP
jgi:hypothetical protein